ncbi:MAG: hypothetical protein C4521_12420 [Actinobacteria bacterium]|nr:MAG: hypothetical protein C4521_12420 [Actinomycetota bacterium]
MSEHEEREPQTPQEWMAYYRELADEANKRADLAEARATAYADLVREVAEYARSDRTAKGTRAWVALKWKCHRVLEQYPPPAPHIPDEPVKRRVYQVENVDAGGGPCFDTPEEAAEFARAESLDFGEPEPGPSFSPEELARLVRPGDKVESLGWSITCLDVSDEEYDWEWSGW